MTPQHVAAFAVSLTLALAGCGSEAGPNLSGESPSPPATSSAPASSSARPSPTAARVLPTDLADGKHYAHLKAFDPKKRTLTADVVQFLTGAEAEKAAQDDGQEAFDYYVRNQNKRLRTLTVGAGAKVTVTTLAGDESGSTSKEVTVSQAELAMYLGGPIGQNLVFWFRLKGGVVVEIFEQYLP
ncbi:MAG TPA: hypothetical protein VNA20_01320 [Frankiaceae bacterium]|nr:hypothetical protein [Frankiaceae bacterium]